jgi:hypothetical protein
VLTNMIEWMIDSSLVLFGTVVVILLFAANEIGFRIGSRHSRRGEPHDRHLAGIGTITAGMLGLLAFTLSLTINIAQNRFELRRSLVLQEANAIQTAWLRAGLIPGTQGTTIRGLIEQFAHIQLAYVSANSFTEEPSLITRKSDVQAQIWKVMEAIAADQDVTRSSTLAAAVIEMFNAARAERFAFDSRVPADMSWMLMAGSLLAIGAMGYHLGTSGSRHFSLTSLLLVMWAGGMVLIADLNRPRIGMIRVDPQPLQWAIGDFDKDR